MKKKLLRLVPALLALTVLLSSCSPFDFFSADDLLKAPGLTGEKAELQQAFEAAAGKSVSPVSPLTGDYRSAFVMYDCDSDGEDEAFVFYSGTENDSSIHMNVLEKKNGEWHSVGDIAGNGSEIYKVDFLNLEDDADKEIAVTWTVSDTKRDKTLSIYKLSRLEDGSGSSVNPLAAVQIFDYVFLDLDGDSRSELFYIYYDTTEEKSGAYAKLLKYNAADTTLVPISELKLNQQIASLLSLKYDTAGDEYELFIDCSVAENTYFTEVIRFDRATNALISPFSLNDMDALTATKRSSVPYSSDIDEDGRIEIPVELISAESYVKNPLPGDNTSLVLIDWQRLKKNSLVSVRRFFVNDDIGISVCTNNLSEFSYIVYDKAAKSIEFRLKNRDENTNLIFSISANPTAGRTDSKYIVYISELGTSMNITKAFVDSIIS